MLVPHPDTAPSNDGNLRLVKLNVVADGILFGLFNDGSLYEVDLKNQKYVDLGGSILSTGNNKLLMTTAHVVDGTTLKSFVIDAVRIILFFYKGKIRVFLLLFFILEQQCLSCSHRCFRQSCKNFCASESHSDSWPTWH